jgi:preprotein translocase subunit Sec63
MFHGRPRKATRAPRQPGRGDARAASLRNAACVAPTPHAVLGVETNASSDVVRAAFKKLVFELHPDRAVGVSPEERAVRGRRLVEVIAAYRAIQ